MERRQSDSTKLLRTDSAWFSLYIINQLRTKSTQADFFFTSEINFAGVSSTMKWRNITSKFFVPALFRLEAHSSAM